VQVVKDTMAKFAADGPSQQELDDAKTYLTGSFPLAFASNSGTASQLGTFQRQNLDIGYVARRNGLIQAVTLADVKRVAKRLFDPARLTVVIGGSPAEGRRAPQRPLPPGSPATAAGPAAGSTPLGAKVPGVTPPSTPVDKPVENPPAAPKSSGEAAKKP
jgi:zinc protease